MARPIPPGAVDQSVTLYFVDSTTGLPKEGLTDASAGLALWYRLQLGAKTAITPAALAALTTAHTDGGFEEIDDGAYRVDLPDAAVAAGSDDVTVGGSATGAIAVPVTHALNFVTETEIQESADAAIVANGLDHLVAAAVAGTDVANDSIVAQIVSKSATADWDSYNNETDAQEATRDKLTDIETDTAVIGAAGAGLTEAGGTGDHLTALSTQASVDDLPTNAELAAELAAADDAVLAAIAALNDLSAAQVNAEVVDALNVDTYAEPAQGTPAATASLVAKIGFLFKAWRNRSTQTATQYSLYNDDAVTVDHKATFSDDATTGDRTEIVTGP